MAGAIATEMFHTATVRPKTWDPGLLCHTSVRGPAHRKTASPTYQKNQWKNDVIFEAQCDHLFYQWLTITLMLVPLPMPTYI